MRAHQFITEDDDVGREFQHIEDLTYIHGPQGALKAIDRLAQIAKDSSHLEVKWDGSPAITFGRNEQGEFHLGDKYAKEYLTSPEAVYAYVIRKSQSEDRQQFGRVMADLYTVYEQATPRDYRGFLECGLMYPTSQQPKPENVNGVYSFKPNTVIYHVQANSPLGKRIAQSYTAAAATGSAGSAGSAVVNQVKAAHNSKAALAASTRSKDRADRATGEGQQIEGFEGYACLPSSCAAQPAGGMVGQQPAV